MERSNVTQRTNQGISMPPIGAQGWTYHETNTKEGWHKDYAYDADKQDTGYKIETKEREESRNNQDGVLDETT